MLDIWYLIAQHCEPDPFLYTKWAHVCRDSRIVFFSNKMWHKFSPVEVDAATTPSLAEAWHLRVRELPPDIYPLYRDVWCEAMSCWYDMSKLDNEWIETRVALFKGALIDAQYFHNSDFGLASLIWMHLHCVMWVPCELRNNNQHRDFVRGKYAGRWPKPLQCAMIELYGPLLRYADDSFLDDKELAIKATRYHMGPRVKHPRHKDPQVAEWDNWQCVPPFTLLSERLQQDPDVRRAFFGRWPELEAECHTPLDCPQAPSPSRPPAARQL